MRKALLGLGLLAGVALAAPRTADAHVSVSIGLPGFGFYVAPPVVYAPRPPVYYAPPVHYRPYYAPSYYAPSYYAPSYYARPVYGRPYCHDHGHHRGWYDHDWDDD